MSYEILFFSKAQSAVGEHIQKSFKAHCLQNASDIADSVNDSRFRAVVIDCAASSGRAMSYAEPILEVASSMELPIIVIADLTAVDDKLAAYDKGCDDVIDTGVSPDEACARINKSIFHRIANEQLSQRLEAATETARTAMVDNSDLGANIQFMLAVHQCDNLDQLGQQLFSAVERYGLKCSLQMRSTIEIKNMEAHGMSKDLESQLLLQMKDSGRYIDFGCRTICNYDRVSLLIKNMPINDPERYGTIKDNTFVLLQGLNARLRAVENHHTLLEEKASLRKLSGDVNGVVSSVKERYQDVMRGIMQEVESATSLLQDRVPHLALVEQDEVFIDSVVERLIQTTNSVFNEGLKLDEIFSKLEKSVDNSLHRLNDHPELGGTQAVPPRVEGGTDLF